MGRSQWPCGLRRRSAAARLLRSWVRIPPGAWMFVCCECCVLSGKGLCDELITRPEESYRLWYVVVCDLEKPREWGGHDPRWVAGPKKVSIYVTKRYLPWSRECCDKRHRKVTYKTLFFFCLQKLLPSQKHIQKWSGGKSFVALKLSVKLQTPGLASLSSL